MRTLLYSSFLLLCILGLSSCEKNEGDYTMVNLLVMDQSGIEQAGVEVFVFNQPDDQVVHKKPADALLSRRTDGDGKVQFNLQNPNLLDAQGRASLSFKVLQASANGDYKIAGSKDLDVKEGDIISTEIIIP